MPAAYPRQADPSATSSVPGPFRNLQIVWDVIRRILVAGHRGRRCPREIVVEHLPNRIVAAKADVAHRLVEARDGATIHLAMRPVSAVRSDHGGLVAELIAVRRRATQCFGPVRSETLRVIRPEAMAEGVTHHLVGHHPLVPRMCEAEDCGGTAHRLEHCRHRQILDDPPDAINVA